MQNLETGLMISQTDVDDVRAILEDMKALDSSEADPELLEELQYHVERIEEILDR